MMAMVAGTVYETFGRTTAYSVIAAVMVALTLLGLWLARGSWGLQRPLNSA